MLRLAGPTKGCLCYCPHFLLSCPRIQGGAWFRVRPHVLLSCRRKKGGAWFCRRPPRSAVMSSGRRAVHGTGILTTCEVRLKDQGRMVS